MTMTHESSLGASHKEASSSSLPTEITALLIEAAQREDQLRNNGARAERIAQDFTRKSMGKLAVASFRHKVSIDDILQGPRPVPSEAPLSPEDEAKLDDLADKLGSYDLARHRLSK